MSQEIYVKEMPKCCAECEHCTKHHKDNYGIPYCLIARMPLYNGSKIYEERGQHKNSLSDFDCPLIDIKAHDRELVKEVCEKIREQLGFIVDGQERIVCDGSATGDKTILAVLNQIQKEYEK